MGLGLFFFKIIKREYYKDVPLGLLLLNFIVQRIFRINQQLPFSVHYTNRVKGYHQMELDATVWKNLTFSNGLYLNAFHEGKFGSRGYIF